MTPRNSQLIPQAGPAALTDGVDALVGFVEEWAARYAFANDPP